jgi:hypothetical protein
MDVLRYSATNAEAYLITQCIEKTACVPIRSTCLSNSNTCLSTLCSQVSALQSTAAAIGPEASCWTSTIEPSLLRNPAQTALWACIPTGSGWTAGFKVCRCAGNAQFNYGRSCSWTVPAGVTCARFQLWGAGGGGSGGACCSSNPFGSTGAYASVIIPVTAGQTYTICSGCALACYPCRFAANRFPGCPSYVQGTGLINFCANGGQGRMGIWSISYGRRNPRRMAQVASNYAGWTMCNGGSHFCSVGSCASCGEIPYVPGASYFGATTSNALVYGIRGIWNRACWDTAANGYFIHPPIYGFESTSQCCFSYSGQCRGVCFSACCGYLQIPGAGGAPNISKSNNYGGCGDMGRAGMVCICYK